MNLARAVAAVLWLVAFAALIFAAGAYIRSTELRCEVYLQFTADDFRTVLQIVDEGDDPTGWIQVGLEHAVMAQEVCR